MRQQGPADKDRDAGTGDGEKGHVMLQLRHVTVLPSNAYVQETENGVEVVVTTNGRGTFLLHSRNGQHPHGRCPLLRFKIRRIDEDVRRQEDRPLATHRRRSISDETGPWPVSMADAVDATRHPHWRAVEEVPYSDDRSLVHSDAAHTGKRG